MAGLINTTPATSATKPVVAEEWKVEDPQTVQGQITGIIAENSPLQQLATTSANQQANSRGLINSSMAVGAAQDATIRAALPIAQQDAQTYGAAAQTNAAATNDTSKFNTELASREGMFNTEQAGINTRFNTEQAGLDTRFNQELAQNMEQFNLSEANKTALLELEQEYKQSIQTSANTATLFNSYFQQVAAIQTSPNITGGSTTPDPENPGRMLTNKELAIDNLTTMLQDGVAAQDAVSGLNIESMVFPDTQNATTPPTATPTAMPTTTPTPNTDGGLGVGYTNYRDRFD